MARGTTASHHVYSPGLEIYKIMVSCATAFMFTALDLRAVVLTWMIIVVKPSILLCKL